MQKIRKIGLALTLILSLGVTACSSKTADTGSAEPKRPAAGGCQGRRSHRNFDRARARPVSEV
ncbi:hypothetical protein VQ056_15840 [Paenibacillus sp. JTLBN-2024]